MMEVNEKLYVKAEDLFDQMAGSVAYDISNSTGKKVRAKNIKKGYTYTKRLKNKLGRKGEVKVTITEFEAPKKYAAEFESVNGINTLSYEITDLGDSIGVTYKEDFVGATKLKSLNNKMMTFFYNRGSKKKARRLLRAMEQYVLHQQAEEQAKLEDNNIDTEEA